MHSVNILFRAIHSVKYKIQCLTFFKESIKVKQSEKINAKYYTALETFVIKSYCTLNRVKHRLATTKSMHDKWNGRSALHSKLTAEIKKTFTTIKKNQYVEFKKGLNTAVLMKSMNIRENTNKKWNNCLRKIHNKLD